MNIIKELNLDPDKFRVAIFGSSRLKPESPIYKDVEELAYKCGLMNLDVVTGGGPGLMEAGNKGHDKATDETGSDAKSIGLRIELPFEEYPNMHMDEKKDFAKFSGRLDAFMEVSNLMVVCPGGVGTLLELAYSWQLMQVGHIKRKPIILLGDMWDKFYDWADSTFIANGLADKEDLDCLIPAPNMEAAVTLIKALHQDFLKNGEDENMGFVKHKKV